jgi:DNA-binding response OmpR family regulator
VTFWALLFANPKREGRNAMPNSDQDHQLLEKLSQLAAAQASVAALTQEIIVSVGQRLGLDQREIAPVTAIAAASSPNGRISARRPIVDAATFSVHWDGKVCVLGNTLPFRLLERLGHRPNQFIHCDQLLDEVWQDLRSREAIRSVVKVLKQKLVQAGMDDLAASIKGNQPHHYGLILNHDL